MCHTVTFCSQICNECYLKNVLSNLIMEHILFLKNKDNEDYSNELKLVTTDLQIYQNAFLIWLCHYLYSVGGKMWGCFTLLYRDLLTLITSFYRRMCKITSERLAVRISTITKYYRNKKKLISEVITSVELILVLPVTIATFEGSFSKLRLIN